MTHPMLGGNLAGGGGNRRRSQRALVVIPVTLTWTTKGGVRVRERAETEVVSATGALVRCKVQLPAASEIELRNPLTNLAAKARVMGASKPSNDGLSRIALELTVASDTFWGIGFPPVGDEASNLRALLGK